MDGECRGWTESTFGLGWEGGWRKGGSSLCGFRLINGLQEQEAEGHYAYGLPFLNEIGAKFYAGHV